MEKKWVISIKYACSHLAINFCPWQIFWRHYVDQKLGVATHQHQAKPLEEVANNLLLLLALVPGKSSSQFLNLLDSHTMQASQCVCCQWDKADAFSPACLTRFCNFPLMAV